MLLPRHAEVMEELLPREQPDLLAHRGMKGSVSAGGRAPVPESV